MPEVTNELMYELLEKIHSRMGRLENGELAEAQRPYEPK